MKLGIGIGWKRGVVRFSFLDQIECSYGSVSNEFKIHTVLSCSMFFGFSIEFLSSCSFNHRLKWVSLFCNFGLKSKSR